MTKTPLKTRILDEIALSGPMPLARYMTLCLTDPDHGYYMSRNPLGRFGDFTTAPEVSQMFGEMIGIWVRQTYEKMGRPPSLRLMELGPGRGTLMADCMRALQTDSALFDALQIDLVEISPVLRATQNTTLSGFDRPIDWHEKIPVTSQLPTIIIANEFLDALPVHVVIRTNEGMAERHVQAQNGVLGYIDLPSAMPMTSTLEALPAGTIVELSPARHQAVLEMADALKGAGGAALIIDYGYGEPHNGSTFQAVQNHQGTDPLQDPGAADLTALVDFQATEAACRAGGLATRAIGTQMDFLLDHGLLARAAELGRGKDAKVQAQLQADVNRLVAPQEMGTLFKVLIAGTSAALVDPS